MSAVPVLRAAAGPPLNRAGRRRPFGRIAGTFRPDPPSPFLAVDHDCCRLDRRPLVQQEEWEAVLRAGRLADAEGAFALAWGSGDGSLLLARDSIGERTLFYAEVPDGLVYASTLSALLATGLVPRRLHLPSVASYLSYAYLPGRETLVEGVFELLPGEMLVFRNGKVSRRAFWSLPAEDQEPRPEEVLRQELRRRLEEAVRRRLSCGETVGASLS